MAYTSIKNQALNNGDKMLNWGDKPIPQGKIEYEKLSSRE